MAFNGPIPQDFVVNHKNGIKANCKLTNLELCTDQQNVQHAIDHNLLVNKGTRNFGQVNGRSLFSDKEVVSLRKKFKANRITVGVVAKDKRTSFRVVRSMLSGRTYSHLPFACTLSVTRGRPKLLA